MAKSRLVISVFIPEEDRDLLEKVEQLRKMDLANISEVFRRALREYVDRHLPGNPQMSLQTFTGQAPLPQTMTGVEPESELRKRIRAADEEYLRSRGG